MTALENVKILAKERELNLQAVAEKAGLGINTIYTWNKKTPSTKSLQAVADVLRTTTAHLLGEDENKINNHPPKVDILDDDVILAFDGMEIPEEDKEKILDYARYLMDQGTRERIQ